MPPSNPPSRWLLFYQDGDFITRVELFGQYTKKRVVRPEVAVSGIAVASSYVYWTTFTGRAGGDAIMRASLAGGQITRVVGHLNFPRAVLAVSGFLYWLDQDAIGRVALDGSRLQRRFIALPRESGGGVGEDLATDGRHLYFSRCQEGAIGRVMLDGSRRDMRFIVLGGRGCPQGLAVGGEHLYWTELRWRGGTIGRASLDGSGVDDAWFTIAGISGPFSLAADAQEIYWTWGGPGGTPRYVGRVRSDRSHQNPRFVPGDNAPVLARCRGNRCRTSP